MIVKAFQDVPQPFDGHNVFHLIFIYLFNLILAGNNHFGLGVFYPELNSLRTEQRQTGDDYGPSF